MLPTVHSTWKRMMFISALPIFLTGLPNSTSAEDAGALYNTPYDVNLGERYLSANVHDVMASTQRAMTKQEPQI